MTLSKKTISILPSLLLAASALGALSPGTEESLPADMPCLRAARGARALEGAMRASGRGETEAAETTEAAAAEAVERRRQQLAKDVGPAAAAVLPLTKAPRIAKEEREQTCVC